MRNVALLLVTTMLTSCSLAPDFAMPSVSPPANYKQNNTEKPSDTTQWKEAVPLAHEDRGQWWKIFGDEALNHLQKQAIETNPSL
jgi:multidrug efflux system outer membrane protein